MKPVRPLLPSLAVAAILFGAVDAEASLLLELDRVVALARNGEVENVELTKRQVEFTVRVDETDVRVVYSVHGKQERKQVRYANLRLQLAGDRQAVYADRGWPTYRTLEDSAGTRTERWTYADEKITFVFAGDRLLRTETF
jgi:hypothetical protein